MSKVLVKYAFIFEPATTWQNRSSFESSLSKYFSEIGLVAELIELTEGDKDQTRYVILHKKAETHEEPLEKTVRQAKADLKRSRGIDGRYKT